MTYLLLGCPNCPTATLVRGLVLDNFSQNFGLMSITLVGVSVAVLGSFIWLRPAPLRGGVLLGAGLGGFLDGILLHQILQWHQMLASRMPPTDLIAAKYNMVFDGLFHAFTWMVTVAGLVVLVLSRQRAEPRAFLGSALIGFGIFNSVEGLIDHHVLGLHHVHPGSGELAWDLGFLASGVVLVGVGAWLIRARSLPQPRPAEA